jgi:sulfite reductase (NADPH) flavoprotein alpha-component
LPGRIIVTIASLTMPLFFVTGWLLYLDRRRKSARCARPWQRRQQRRRQLADRFRQPERLCRATGLAERRAIAGGRPAGAVRAAGRVGRNDLRQANRALFVVSTFGDGEAPDSARAFERKVLGQPWALNT